MQKKAEILAKQLGEILLQRRLKVTCAESCTGGGISHALTEIAGSSQWFEYGFITYANQAKQHILHVSEQALQTHGAVSQLVVEQMALGALDTASADIAVAVSGVAGPGGGTEEKPVGTVWFCWRAVGGKVKTHCEVFAGSRAEVRSAAVEKSLLGLLDILNE